jgi:hypothetical protein
VPSLNVIKFAVVDAATRPDRVFPAPAVDFTAIASTPAAGDVTYFEPVDKMKPPDTVIPLATTFKPPLTVARPVVAKPLPMYN